MARYREPLYACRKRGRPIYREQGRTTRAWT